MKQLICIILALFCLMPLHGCKQEEQTPVYSFYYPRADRGYNVQENRFYEQAITAEQREDIVYISARQMITAYIQGPQTPIYSNPFPKGLELVAISIRNQTLYCTFTDHLAELTGTDLIIACTCITKTGIDLTRATTVQIRCETAMLDGKTAIEMNNATTIISDLATSTQEE